MIKKILIGLGVLVIILGAAFFYLNNRGRTLSPPGNVELTAGNLTASITYNRPSVRGRLIFGTKEAGALQPYGQYWRLGANESTEITLNHDVKFNGEALKAGTYRVYAIPGPDTFEIIVNTELGKWGAFEPNHDLDILHTTVPVQKLTSSVEQYTIRMEPLETGILIIFEWSDTQFGIPITTP
ncbi:MAG: DUF2911 domain-containing protein [Cyclobacteriaceae bacterium]|nr:DUF2911 domain-containing protein [Cyclobacteriaceae bacterium]